MNMYQLGAQSLTVRPAPQTQPFRTGRTSLVHINALLHHWEFRTPAELAHIYPRVIRALKNVPPEYQTRAYNLSRHFRQYVLGAK